MLRIGGVLLILGLGLFLLRSKNAKRLQIACLSFALGLGWYFFYSELTLVPAHELSGTDAEITVTALDYPECSSGYARVKAELKLDGALPLELYLYDSTYGIRDVRPGQSLSIEARLKASDVRYGKTDETYPSAGIFLIATGRSAPVLGEVKHSLRILPAEAKHALLSAVGSLFSDETAAFLRALLLGEKSEFYQSVSLSTAMSKAGLSHTVAVSGMHISFLVTLLQLLFGNTKRRSVFALVLIWFFVFMTGASPSAFRAGFMQTVLLLAPFFRRENDPPTSLAFALLVLLVLNPFAVRSVSLQLSFAAMAGLLCFSARLDRAFRRPFGRAQHSRPVQYFSGAFACSFSVMVFTVPLTAYYFGSLQVLAPIVNFCVLWAVSLCFIGGYASVVLFFLFERAGIICAVPVKLLAEYIISAAKFFSSFSFSCLYTENDGTLYWAAFVYLLFFLLSVWKPQRKWKSLTAAAATLLSLVLLLEGTAFWYRTQKGVFSVINVGQGQSLAIFSGDKTVVIDCGNTMTDQNAGEIAGKYLLSCGRDRIDLLLITHLHEDHANGIAALMEYLPVSEIVLSSEAAGEASLRQEILEASAQKGTRITSISSDSEAVLGDIVLRLYPPETAGKDENEACIFSVVSIGDYDLLVTGDADKDAERRFLSSHDLPEIDLLAVGHHGSKYSTSSELLQSCSSAVAAVSTGYNTYGHPAAETLSALSEAGLTVHRTDLEGTLQFVLEDAKK